MMVKIIPPWNINGMKLLDIYMVLEEDETAPELGVDSFLNKYLDKVEG